jgi:S-adenosylmethionine:diacylglycerol 3-amino-3-carboxypropyl transferase
LQLHTIGRLLSLDAAPNYLGDGFTSVRKQAGCVEWVQSNVLDYVRESMPDEVTRAYLSNLPDWCSAADFEHLVSGLALKLPPDARILWSSLHTDWQLPARVSSVLKLQSDNGNSPSDFDRFPFYTFTCTRVAGVAEAGQETK